MSIKKTSIQISENLKNRLLKLRLTPRESYEEIINRIVKKLKEVKGKNIKLKAEISQLKERISNYER